VIICLDLYEQPYCAKKPVICFDERPCQLIGDVLGPMPMRSGRVKQEDYQYERNGTCVVLLAVEPLSGKRVVEVRKRRTKKDYAEFIKALAEKHYPNAEEIILIQDNLNTHNPSSFHERFPAGEAFELAKRFRMVYTPKKASWLNMAEIEFSALSKQCLDRRIAEMDVLSREVYTWVEKRNQEKVTLDWQFTKNNARDKFERFYGNIRN